MHVLPEVRLPDRRFTFKRATLWEPISLSAALVCCRFSLYGVMASKSADFAYWVRVITGLIRSTSIQLSISLVIASDMVMQLLAVCGAIDVTQSLKEDCELFGDVQ